MLSSKGVIFINTLKYETDELYHYGVKGMKWGVRKARKKAAVERVTGRSSLSTGKHYDEVHKQLQKDAEPLNKRYKPRYDKLVDDYAKLMAKRDSDAKKMSGPDFHAKHGPLLMDLRARTNQLNAEYYRDKMALVDKYADKFNKATLKDINYRDVEKGAEYLKKKGITLFDVYL